MFVFEKVRCFEIIESLIGIDVFIGSVLFYDWKRLCVRVLGVEVMVRW